jgi:hypothetical protein
VGKVNVVDAQVFSHGGPDANLLPVADFDLGVAGIISMEYGGSVYR